MGLDSDKKTRLTIGRLARESGLSVSTIRYYQQRNLLREPKKPLMGTRVYSEADLARLNMIRQTQELGFTLAEIGELIAYSEANQCRDILALVKKKLQAIKSQIKELDNKRKTLTALVAYCSADLECGDDCSLIHEFRSSTLNVGDCEKCCKKSP